MALSDENEPTKATAATRRPFQFSLRWLLALPVWLALFFASIAWWGLPGAMTFTFLFCLGYTLLVRPPENATCPFRRQYAVLLPVWILLCVFMIPVCLHSSLGLLFFWVLFLFAIVSTVTFLLLGLFLPSMHWFCAGLGFLVVNLFLLSPLVSRAGPAAYRMQCTNNLKQIGLALHNYHDTFGCFPPAYVADAEGRPLYSWRVLILPSIERKPLYDAFHLDEPWDSPNNLPLSQTEIYDFLCPSNDQKRSPQRSSMTNYLAVVGPGTLWPGTGSRRFGDVADGTSNTIAIVEVRNCGVHWAEPRDLHVDQMASVINPQAGEGISSAHQGGANVLITDGSTRFLSSNFPAKTLRALLTIAGGEGIEAEEF